jgi:DNA adenine methylase
MTQKYHTSFPYEEYYEWVKHMSRDNIVLCSEYWMPDDFECIWEKELNNNLATVNSGSKEVNREKLFVWRDGLCGKDYLKF